MFTKSWSPLSIGVPVDVICLYWLGGHFEKGDGNYTVEMARPLADLQRPLYRWPACHALFPMTLSSGLRFATDLPLADADLEAALARAMEAARDPFGMSQKELWQFRVLSPEISAAVAWLAARRLEAEVDLESARAAYEQWRAVPGWIAVTCARSSDPERMERLREAGRTAAQRYSLSLWSDNVPSNWVPDLVADDPAFYRLINADPSREEALGILLYGHPEHPIGGGE